MLKIKINRKEYSIPAMICDIKQDILGADFIKKYRLGLEWDDFDQTELFIVDKRANIKAPTYLDLPDNAFPSSGPNPGAIGLRGCSSLLTWMDIHLRGTLGGELGPGRLLHGQSMEGNDVKIKHRHQIFSLISP